MAFGSEQWMYSSGGFYDYPIDQSLRFNDDDSAYLSRTPATTGNRKTWTWSGWVKRGNLGSQQDLFGAGASGSADDRIGFLSNDTFYFYSSNGTTIYRVDTNAVFRDVGSWYHIFVSTDTTQATEANRVKVWVNGVQQTLTEQNSGYPVQDYQYVGFNTTNQHIISAWNQLAGYYHLDGYMAEVNFIDGQALDATDFGEFKSGVWIPKSYSGTYGTNGFYLPFNDAGFLGKDNSTVLGPDLVTNGSFDTDTSNWLLNGFCTTSWLSSGKMQINRTGGTGPTAYQAITCEIGATYAIRTQINSVGSRGDLRVNEAVNSGTILNLSGTNGATVDISGQFTATQTTHYLQFYIDNGGTSIIVDDVSVKKISSQGNDWAIKNLAVTDQMLDSPTNNFATLNPLFEGGLGSGNILSEGNLRYTGTGAGSEKYNAGTFVVTTGKWYFEVLKNSGTHGAVGFTDGALSQSDAQQTNPMDLFIGGMLYSTAGVFNGKRINSTTTTSLSISPENGDVMAFALDADTGEIWLGEVIGGVITWESGGDPALGTLPSGTITTCPNGYTPFASHWSAIGGRDFDGTFNFGQSAFVATPPDGYLALCTANLPDPVIDPAQDDVPEDYFNTVTYTGNGSTQSITGVGFQPDWVWLKLRNVAANHGLHDALRVINGNAEILYSNLTNAGNTGGGYLSSFDSDGFTVNNNTSGNGSGYTFAAWNWKADGTGVTNTDGSITSTVSANQKAGFSIVSWTGNGNSSGNVGTGLSSSIPIDMAIVKKRSTTSEWQVGHRASGQGVNFAYHLELNSTSALSGQAPYMMGSQATSNAGLLFLASEGLTNGVDYIAYCFTSVDGYSKFGSYTGNGSADGPFVYTGFRPAFVIIKRTNDIASWATWDSTRDTYNPMDTIVFPNLSNAEATNAAYNIDALSNGFKVRNTATSFNGNTSTYIYMAFAEMPFKYSNAR